MQCDFPLFFGGVERQPETDHAQSSSQDSQVAGYLLQRAEPTPLANGLPLLRQVNTGRRLLRMAFGAKA